MENGSDRGSPVETNIPQEFADFDFNGNHFTVLKRSYYTTKEYANDILFMVKDQSDVNHVKILGRLKQGNPVEDDQTRATIFEVMSSNNLMFEQDSRLKKPGHIPHLTAETIAQLVLQGKIDQWFSNKYLTDGGISLYEFIKSIWLIS